MNRLLNNWLVENGKMNGVLGCAIRYPDKTNYSQSHSADFPQAPMDLAWRCMGDTFQVLKLHKKPAQRLRWVFENAYLYCQSRKDGVCLGVFTVRDSTIGPAPEQLNALFREFETFK